MDERLQKALEFSNYLQTFHNQKNILKEQFLQNIVHYCNGGKFTISRELIAFCYHRQERSFVLIDDNHDPIYIENLKMFLQQIEETYMTQVNKYYQELKTLKSTRTVQGLVDD